LVFPSVRAKLRPISENTLNAALRRLGYASGDMTTPHPRRRVGVIAARWNEIDGPLAPEYHFTGAGPACATGRRTQSPPQAARPALTFMSAVGGGSMARRYTSPYLGLRDAVPLIIERLGLMTDDREGPNEPLRDACTQLIAALRDGVIQAEGQLSVVANDIQFSVIAQHPVQAITTDWWIGVDLDVEINWIGSGMMRKLGDRFEMMRAIRIKRTDLDRVWPSSKLTQESQGAATKALAKQRGPVRGTTGFQASDRKLFSQIDKLIKSGNARSPHDAALILADKEKIMGPGSRENKARRLASRYRKERRGANH
jgi:hypothetical protein